MLQLSCIFLDYGQCSFVTAPWLYPSPRAQAPSPKILLYVLLYLQSPSCASLKSDEELLTARPHHSTPSPTSQAPSRATRVPTTWLSLELSLPVLGTLQALPDASQAPARSRLPAARAPAPDPPLHLGADALPGGALDPQVHDGRHHLPSHGEVGPASPSCSVDSSWAGVHGEGRLTFSSPMA